MPSAYEQEREARIAANNNILTSLGIHETRDKLAFLLEGSLLTPSPIRMSAKAASPAKSPASRPRVKKERVDVPEALLRRSSRSTAGARLESLPDSWREPGAFGSDDDEEERSKPRKQPRKAAAGPPREAPPPDPSSSRSIKAQCKVLEDCRGVRVPGGHVKNGIMAFVNGGSVPKFSKYVGVQEWANCVLLMFNLSASSKGQTYTNSFVGQPGGGMHVTYYLSDRTRPDAPIVDRLVSSSVRDFGDDGGGKKGCGVHLFVRPDGDAYKMGVVDAPDYLYLGRLKYVSHTAEEGRAVEFVFDMVDYAEVKLTDEYKQLISIVE